MQGKKDQKQLFCEDYIDDRLNKDHEVYAFDKIMDGLDIRSIEDRYSKEGGRAYHPRMMLKILFYGYHRGIRSSRKLALACEESIPFIYLAGDLKIKFRVIADFRVRFCHELKEIYREIIGYGYRLGLVTGKRGYQDGSKFQADASNEKFKKKEEWEKEEKELIRELDEYFENAVKIDAVEDEMFGKEHQGHGSLGGEDRLEDLFRKLEALVEENRKEKRKKAASNRHPPEDSGQGGVDDHDGEKKHETVDDNETAMFEKAEQVLKIHAMLTRNSEEHGDTKLNLTDPDSRFMKCRGKIDSNYNAQVFTENGFIIAADVTTDETDYDQLEPIVEQVAQNLPQTKLEQAGFDAGYFSGRNLKYLAEKGIKGYIPEHNNHYLEALKSDENALHKEGFRIYNFKYDSAANQWICPAGNRLEFARNEEHEGSKYDIYRSKPTLCMLCPHHETCLSTKNDKKLGYRSLRTDEFTLYRTGMILKMQTDEAKKFFSRRKVEPEPVFGNMKRNKAFRNFLVRGLDKVRGEFMIMCSVQNIGKIINQIRGDPATV